MPRDSLKLLLLVPFFRSFRVYWWPRIASWIVRYLEGCTHLPPDTRNKDVTPVHEGYGFRDSIDPRTGQVCPHLLSLDKGMEAIALHNFLAELEGNAGVWDYFWLYLKAIDRDEEAMSLLSEVRFPF